MPSDLAYRRFAAPSPTPYHKTLAAALQRREPDLWAWFASDHAQATASDGLRLELLKGAYRLEESAHGEPIAAAQEIATAMALDAEPILYQAEHGRLARSGRGAALFYERDVAHILFSGDALSVLDEAELRFAIGHELAHHKLWSEEDGRYWTVSRLLDWASRAAGAAPSWEETKRLEQLYTELYADRYGLWSVGDLDPALSAQIKMTTGLDDASGAAYLAQAEEALIASAEHDRSDGESHPEGYLRAALLATWAHEPAAAETRSRSLIQGAAPLQKLDVLAQEGLADLTGWLLSAFLTEPWRSRAAIKAHARAISSQLAAEIESASDSEDADSDRLRVAIAGAHPTVREYLAYILLDFVTADPQLDDVMLTLGLQFGEDFGLSTEFKSVAAKELKTTRTKLAELERNSQDILKRAVLSLSTPDDALEPPRPSRRRAAAASGAA